MNYNQGYDKIKQIYRLHFFGDDDVLRGNADSVYATNTVKNVKRIRFNLNTIFNDYQLSQSSRLVLESCNLPAITGVNKYVVLRMICNSDDVSFDSHKLNAGNPVLAIFKSSDQTIINQSDQVYSLSVKDYVFRKNFIEFEVEVPTATSNIDFLTNNPLDNFFISFYIYDIDNQLTEDVILAPPQISKKTISNRPPRHIT
jgi:hypothetical protein